MSQGKKRVLIFIVAYHAEKTIQSVLSRIPVSLQERYEIEVLVIDDCSGDRTFEEAQRVGSSAKIPFPVKVLFNPQNLGYGGNQKIGFHYAVKQGFDFVALVHGDGQYAPESLPQLLEPLDQGEADAVFGSRMLTSGGAIRGGMPLYKFIGNKILTFVQNFLLHSNLSEFHSGYRLYSTAALKKIPFDLNSQVFHFDTEIIIQLLRAKQRILELPIPTYYGDEICRVNGIRYAWDVVVASFIAWCQDKGIFYERKFDCVPGDLENADLYQDKIAFESPHSIAFEEAHPGERVVDIGCGSGHFSRHLKAKGCHVVGIDQHQSTDLSAFDRFIRHNLDDPSFPVDFQDFDLILLLDVIEHTAEPEIFLERVRQALILNPKARLIISTGNVAFLPVRLMMMLGKMNYGKRGILDLTHKRLFTFASLERLLKQGGFEILSRRGVAGPFPLVFGNGLLGRFLQVLTGFGHALLPGLFAYQMIFVARAKPSLEYLLLAAEISSEKRERDSSSDLTNKSISMASLKEM